VLFILIEFLKPLQYESLHRKLPPLITLLELNGSLGSKLFVGPIGLFVIPFEMVE
jgi:hypothetical protein